MNVFCVTVSENCRKQPRKMLDFVVQTESEQNDVYRHYSNCYAGFCVNVSGVTVLNLNIEKPEIQKDNPTKQSIVKDFTIENPPLTDEEKADLITFLGKRNEASDIVSKLSRKIESRLGTKYNDICHDRVSVEIRALKEWPRHANDYKITAKIALRGSIVEHITNGLNQPANIN